MGSILLYYVALKTVSAEWRNSSKHSPSSLYDLHGKSNKYNWIIDVIHTDVSKIPLTMYLLKWDRP